MGLLTKYILRMRDGLQYRLIPRARDRRKTKENRVREDHLEY